ncbi:MAG: ABC transporter ATP-binding protein [Sphaerochaetaceae bacterium]|nr:ABC transporter ATP-binding protein [Sphaerochaetaceae bacterium]
MKINNNKTINSEPFDNHDPPILSIKNLNVQYKNYEQYYALNSITFDLKKNEVLGIIGESGSGKSTLAMTIMGLLKEKISGDIYYKKTNLLKCNKKEISALRWEEIAIVFQNSLDVLNPLLSVGEQILETILEHKKISRPTAIHLVHELLALVKLNKKWYYAFPHELSGGMRQKVLIAMAISLNPKVLIVDEPTMALDAINKKEITQLLKRLQKQHQFSMIVISHELPIIKELTNELIVLYGGIIVEKGSTKDVILNPEHPYSRGLLESSPAINPYKDMWGIPGESNMGEKNKCPFYDRCTQRINICKTKMPELKENNNKRLVSCHRGGIITMLTAHNICKTYDKIEACINCSIDLRSGEVISLIGQTGSGKSTFAEIIAGVIKADTGIVHFEGRIVNNNSETSKMNGMQMIFQDPISSINEQKTILKIIKEPLDILKWKTKDERKAKVIDMLKNVQLPTSDSFLEKKGFMLSGGQKQRISIARALITEPKLLIADEISAMLDASTGANILRLIKGLQNKIGFSMLFITHDLSLAQKVSDKIYVMKQGKIIEKGPTLEIFTNPKNEYTKELLNYFVSQKIE